MLVNERHRRGTFANRAADALYRSRPHVTDRVHARHARFEGNGRPPVSGLHRRSRDDEAVRIEHDATAAEPFGFRISANEYEQVPNFVCCLNAGAPVTPRSGCEPAFGAGYGWPAVEAGRPLSRGA
jgi:hypothetical protein